MHENISKCFCKSLNLGTEVKKKWNKILKKIFEKRIFFQVPGPGWTESKIRKKNSKSQGLGQETKKLKKGLQVSGPVREKKIK